MNNGTIFTSVAFFPVGSFVQYLDRELHLSLVHLRSFFVRPDSPAHELYFSAKLAENIIILVNN